MSNHHPTPTLERQRVEGDGEEGEMTPPDLIRPPVPLSISSAHALAYHWSKTPFRQSACRPSPKGGQ